MKNFKPHEPTATEEDKALTISNLYDHYCNTQYCAFCEFFNSTADCKILFAVQYLQKEAALEDNNNPRNLFR